MTRRAVAAGLVCAVLSIGAAPAERPDLIVSALSTPLGLRQGNCNRFDVLIDNLEDRATTQSITVRLHVQYPNKGAGQHIRVLKGIGARGQSGASQAVRFDAITIPEGGRVSYTATVNPDGVVSEAVIDERNSVSGSGTAGGACPTR